MAVYVDEIHCYPTKIPCFKNGSCHLVADSLEELHVFAEKIGMRRAWFQNHRRLPHYDLTPSRRVAAIKLGAIEDDGLRGFISRMRETKND